MFRALCLVVFLLSCAYLTPAEAKVFIHPGIIYLESGTDDGTSSTSTRRILYDIAGGYTFEKGWMLGLIYGNEKITTKSGSTETNATRSSFGPSFGWMSSSDDSGPYARGHYFVSSEYEVGGARYTGWGYQADLGFRFPIKRASLSLQLSYKSYEYKKYSYGSTSYDLTSPIKHTFIDPMVGIFIGF